MADPATTPSQQLGTVTTGYSTTTGLPILSETFPRGAATPQTIVDTSYDSLFRVQCVAQRLNTTSSPNACVHTTIVGTDGPDRITQNTYNAASQLISSTSNIDITGVNPRLNVFNIYNDNNGTLASVADDKGDTTSYTYDNFDRAIQTCFPNPSTPLASSTGDCASVTYTGARATAITPRGFTTAINLTYDADGNLAGKSAVAGQVAIETFAYNAFGQVTSHGANGITETYGYNTIDGLVSDAQPMGGVAHTVTYNYDTVGRRAKMTYPPVGTTPFYVAYTYNNDNTVAAEKVSYNGGAEVNYAQFVYNNFAQVQTITYGSGSPLPVVVTPTFDASARLSNLQSSMAGTVAAWALGYNNTTGQLKTETQTGSPSYKYVAPINISNTYGINGLNQVTNRSGTSFTYDTKGNLTSDGTSTYTYNGYNLLATKGANITLFYDASNRLQKIAKTGTGATTSQFVYDGTDMIAEYDGSGNLTSRYLHGPGTDNPMVWFEGVNASTPHYLVPDAHGSIVGVADINGTSEAINTYDEYGQPLTSNALKASRFRYTGQMWLSEASLYYYKNRMYDPTLGRFLQPDPIGYGGGMNMYNYVQGDPINGSDPSGLLDVPDGHGGTCDIHHYEDVRNGPDGRPNYNDVLVDFGFSGSCLNGDTGDYGYAGNGGREAALLGEATAQHLPEFLKEVMKVSNKVLCGADYYSGNIYVGNGGQQGSSGLDINITLDRYGHVYGATGPYVSTGRGFDIGVYYLPNMHNGSNSPTERQIHSALTGMTWTVGLNFILGINVSVSADNPLEASSMGLVGGTPGGGISETIGMEIPDSILKKIGLSNSMLKNQLDDACGR